MRRYLGFAIMTIAGLCTVPNPVHAANGPPRGNSGDWANHDTAVYVVSTLNVLTTRSGRSVTVLLKQKLGVTHFDVWADERAAGLYFIQLGRDDGTTAGVLAYQMGWAKPRSLTRFMSRFASRAPSAVGQAFRLDPKHLLGSFTSTFPS